MALVAAGYTVMAINPLQAAEFRRRLGVSGAKSDASDAHVLDDMVRTHSHQLRPVAGDSARADWTPGLGGGEVTPHQIRNRAGVAGQGGDRPPGPRLHRRQKPSSRMSWRTSSGDTCSPDRANTAWIRRWP